MALLGTRKHYLMYTVERRHFSSTAQKVGYADSAEPLIETLLERTPGAIAEVRAALPAGLSENVAEAVLGGVELAAKALRDGALNR